MHRLPHGRGSVSLSKKYFVGVLRTVMFRNQKPETRNQKPKTVLFYQKYVFTTFGDAGVPEITFTCRTS
jgi:hypothetical protein